MAERLRGRGGVRLAVVGDAHGQWSARDAACVKALGLAGPAPPFLIVVGDIGNEAVDLVRQIAEFDWPKAVICGNHDAWSLIRSAMTTHKRAQTSSSSPPSPSHAAAAAAVRQQLDLLGEQHVAWRRAAVPGKDASVVGARPFSQGGRNFAAQAFLAERFGVRSLQESAARILLAARAAGDDGHAVVVAAHNGPSGLGADKSSPFGRDWLRGDEAGDHGDDDLADALAAMAAEGRRAALVVAGHMHHRLRHGGLRTMAAVDPHGTLVLNSATVPRVAGAPPGATRHHFLVVDVVGGRPRCAADVWLEVRPASSSGGGSGDGGGNEQQQQLNDDNGGGGGSSAAARLKAAADPQAQQQLLLDRAPRRVDEFDVCVAEVREVVRCCPSPAAAAGGDISDGEPLPLELWDAHSGAWRRVNLPPVGRRAGGQQAAAVPVSAAAAAAVGE